MIKTVNENDNEKVTLAIEGDLNIYSVNELKNGILEFQERFDELELDLSEVTRMDSAGFQLLSVFKREAANQNKLFNIINPTDEVTGIFNLYGENL